MDPRFVCDRMTFPKSKPGSKPTNNVGSPGKTIWNEAIDDNGLLEDATLLTALEALLNVLPAVANPEKGTKLDANLAGAGSDFEALEKLRRLAFAEQVPEPKVQKLLFDAARGPADAADGEDDGSEESGAD